MNNKLVILIGAIVAVLGLVGAFIFDKIELEVLVLASTTVGSIFYGLYKKFELDEVNDELINLQFKSDLKDTKLKALEKENIESFTENQKLKDKISYDEQEFDFLKTQLEYKEDQLGSRVAHCISLENELNYLKKTKPEINIPVDLKDDTPPLIKRKPRKTKTSK